MLNTLQSSFINFESVKKLEEKPNAIIFNNEQFADEDEIGFLELKNEIEKELKKKEEFQDFEIENSYNSSIETSFANFSCSMWENKKIPEENSIIFSKKFDKLKEMDKKFIRMSEKKKSLQIIRNPKSTLFLADEFKVSKKNKTANFIPLNTIFLSQNAENMSNSTNNSISTNLSKTYFNNSRRNSTSSVNTEFMTNNNLLNINSYEYFCNNRRNYPFNNVISKEETNRENFRNLINLNKLRRVTLDSTIECSSQIPIKSSIFADQSYSSLSRRNIFIDAENVNGNLINHQRQDPNINLSNKTPFDFFLKELENDLFSSKNNLDDASNKISLENVLKGSDKRTTLMIRHIPNKYKLKSIIEEIDEEFKGKYDFFYLPLDYVNNCNLGYAFINFVDSMHILQFYSKYRAKRWRKFNSEKRCELAYAKIQGKNHLVTHFERGTVMQTNDPDKRPIILQTPVFLPKIEIPIKFYEDFVAYYPYSTVNILRDTFIVISFRF